MNKLKMFRWFAGIALAVMSIVAGVLPVYAQVDLPSVQQITQVECYRSVLEINDVLLLISFNIDYATNPDLGIDDTYLFRMVENVTGNLTGSTTAYPYFNDGYDRGIAAIYFSASDAPVWNTAHTIYFDGNPTLHWFADTATTAMAGAVYADGAVLTTQTTGANNSTANDMTLLPAVPAVDDAYYFGSDRMFDKLTLNIGTATGASVWTITWEYWDGDSWDAFTTPVDGTNGFRAAIGNHDVTWDTPVDWNATAVNAITAYWARGRVSAFTSNTTQPLGTQSWVNSTNPPSINTNTITWIDEGSVSDAQSRLTTRLRAIARILEIDWGGTTDLIEDSAGGKVLTVDGEEYFTNTIVDLRSMCPDLFYQEMLAAEYEHDILVTDLLSSGADGVSSVSGANWTAQVFAPSERYAITGVNIPVYRVGNPGTITVSLRATAVGVPTGIELAPAISGAYDGNTVTTNTSGEWISVAFTDDYTLTASTNYSIVVRTTTAVFPACINWLVDTGGGYANGQEATSVNSGGAWIAVSTNDTLFEIMARGGMTPRSGRIEGRLSGTTFDVSQIAINWGNSVMWINAILWIGMIFVLCWAMALATNEWDCTLLVVAICTSYGWRSGFVDTAFFALTMAGLALGVVYAAFWKKSY